MLALFTADEAIEEQVREALVRTRAYAAGGGDTAQEIRGRMQVVKVARDAQTAAGAAAARSVAQAAAVAHMGAHALGAAAYAAKAVSLASPDDAAQAVAAEIRWQLAQLDDDEREILRKLPRVGSDTSGPLGPGLLSRGLLGAVIEELQDAIDTTGEAAAMDGRPR